MKSVSDITHNSPIFLEKVRKTFTIATVKKIRFDGIKNRYYVKNISYRFWTNKVEVLGSWKKDVVVKTKNVKRNRGVKDIKVSTPPPKIMQGHFGEGGYILADTDKCLL